MIYYPLVATIIAVALIFVLTAIAYAEMALVAYMFCLLFFFTFILVWILCVFFGLSWRLLFGISPLAFGGAIYFLVVDHSLLGIILGIFILLIAGIATKTASDGTDMWFLHRRNWRWAIIQVLVVVATLCYNC